MLWIVSSTLLFRNLNSTKCSSEKLQILHHILCIRKKIHAYTTKFYFVFQFLQLYHKNALVYVDIDQQGIYKGRILGKM